MFNIATILICLIIGFILGMGFVLINRMMTYKRKTIKQHSFSDRNRDKKLVADSKFLKKSREEYASDGFKE